MKKKNDESKKKFTIKKVRGLSMINDPASNHFAPQVYAKCATPYDETMRNFGFRCIGADNKFNISFTCKINTETNRIVSQSGHYYSLLNNNDSSRSSGYIDKNNNFKEAVNEKGKRVLSLKCKDLADVYISEDESITLNQYQLLYINDEERYIEFTYKLLKDEIKDITDSDELGMPGSFSICLSMLDNNDLKLIKFEKVEEDRTVTINCDTPDNQHPAPSNDQLVRVLHFEEDDDKYLVKFVGDSDNPKFIIEKGTSDYHSIRSIINLNSTLDNVTKISYLDKYTSPVSSLGIYDSIDIDMEASTIKIESQYHDPILLLSGCRSSYYKSLDYQFGEKEYKNSYKHDKLFYAIDTDDTTTNSTKNKYSLEINDDIEKVYISDNDTTKYSEMPIENDFLYEVFYDDKGNEKDKDLYNLFTLTDLVSLLDKTFEYANKKFGDNKEFHSIFKYAPVVERNVAELNINLNINILLCKLDNLLDRLMSK